MPGVDPGRAGAGRTTTDLCDSSRTSRQIRVSPKTFAISESSLTGNALVNYYQTRKYQVSIRVEPDTRTATSDSFLVGSVFRHQSVPERRTKRRIRR